MAPLPAADKARPSRSRRGTRPSGDDREQAILTTAERLLADRTLGEISIDDLARGAGISRPTFYFYFPSKDAVLLTLLDRVNAEADSAAFGLFGQSTEDPAKLWRAGISAFFTTFSAHRAVAVAAAQAKAGNSEVRELWSRVMEKWVRQTEEIIQSERDRGAAPPGIPVRDLAVTLNLMNERVMHTIFAAEHPALDESRAVDTLLHVWLNSIYLTTPDVACSR
ncbi:MAG: TetR/AcrR family transcriptional regulator, ethionamide resistance regulator [Pseudonocardiales bacterium]|nr:TetR/AcrR family transcriptional regulator, ethionamide resistance regulator [Pseudonocardiales bacterium]